MQYKWLRPGPACSCGEKTKKPSEHIFDGFSYALSVGYYDTRITVAEDAWTWARPYNVPMRTFAFIDASNLFYGGRKSLGWSIDYQKLIAYLQEKYRVERAYFFGGVEIHHFEFDYLTFETIPIPQLEMYLQDLIRKEGRRMTEARLLALDKQLKRVHFYRKLEQFGYRLILKPVKTFIDEDGNKTRKANCDVDMAYYLMREQHDFERALILSGDGDFLPVLKHLRKNGKQVIVLARSPRTAREIKQFAGSDFRDFTYLRKDLEHFEEA